MPWMSKVLDAGAITGARGTHRLRTDLCSTVCPGQLRYAVTAGHTIYVSVRNSSCGFTVSRC